MSTYGAENISNDESVIDFEDYFDNTPEKNDGKGGKADKKLLKKLIESDNIVELLDEDDKVKIVSKILKEFEEDKRSMADWLEYADKAMELTQLKREPKNTPWRNAANIKLPMITTAVLQCVSRMTSEIVKNGQVAKYKIIGQDPSGSKNRKGRRIQTHLNLQILEKIPNWLDEMESLIQQLAVCGTSFTKTFFDPVNGLIRSQTIPYDQLIVNAGIKSLEDAPRVNHLVYYTDNDLIENMRWDLFCTTDVEALCKDKEDAEAIMHEVIEVHNWLDLDGDGLAEPYICTVHLGNQYLLRIKARYSEEDILYNTKKQVKKIFPEHYFTGYKFIPNPDLSYFGYGFGTLLLDQNLTCNTIINQLINAGTLATHQGGFIDKNLKIKKEELEMELGSWITGEVPQGMRMADMMAPLIYKEPSQVLFALFQFLWEMAKAVSATSDVMTGTQDTTNTSPNTLLLLQKEGLKVYSSVLRRVLRSGKKDLEKIVKLNSKHVNVEEYVEVSGVPQQIQGPQGPIPNPEYAEMFNEYGEFQDYNLEHIDIVPMIDINDSTQQESLMKVQALMQAIPTMAQIGAANPREGFRYILDGLEIDPSIINKVVAPEPQPQPSPEMLQMQMDKESSDKDFALKQQKLQLEGIQVQSKAKLQEAQAHKAIADADAHHGKVQLDVAKTAITDKLEKQKLMMNSMLAHHDDIIEIHKVNTDLSKVKAQNAHEKAQPSKSDSSTLNIPDPDVVHAEALRRGWKPRGNE